jgi:signal transduction histidine kinase
MIFTLASAPLVPSPDMVNVLIVDDEPRNLTVLESVLDDPSYRLVRATSGQEALMALLTDEFAVLVLDVRMPTMTGFELAQTIKLRKKTAGVPIIFLTAYFNEDRHKLEGYGSGAVDYLHKPIDAAVLRTKVAVFAELHRNRRALELANDALRVEVIERRRAQESLNELNATLDRRVTERTNALEAREAELRDINRRKDEFLATLAHELRNPLAPIRNAVELLRRTSSFTPDSKWATDLIERQVLVLQRLIEDLMDVSRINVGKIDLRNEWLEVGALLREAIESTRPFIDELGHQVSVTGMLGPIYVHGDAARLAQAFTNLLHNAAKYTDRGGSIFIELERAGDQLLVRVRDTGIGIPSDKLEHVFDLFAQVETAMSRSRGGLGIGLSLTKRLIELHGGGVVAHSDGLGFGSEFLVRLPLKDQPPNPAPFHSAAPRTESKDDECRRLRVLVADDNVDAAITLQAILEDMGQTVFVVHDGATAVAAAENFQPDLCILDIGMPGMSGLDACRRIRLLGCGQSMTLVACTGWGQPENLRQSAEAGFDHHWVKPIDPVKLVDLLHAM